MGDERAVLSNESACDTGRRAGSDWLVQSDVSDPDGLHKPEMSYFMACGLSGQKTR